MEWIYVGLIVFLLVFCVTLWKRVNDVEFENHHLRKTRRRVQLVWGHTLDDFPILADSCQWIAGDAAMPIEAFVEHLKRQYPESMQP